jgi:hypothetical protein
MKLHTTLIAFTVSALAAGLLAGCATEAPTADTEDALPEVSIENYDDVTATLDFEHAVATLPLDQYDIDSPEYVIRVLHAIAVRTDECMVDAGFPATAGSSDWTPYQQEEDRGYGLWSVAYASQFGTDLANVAGAPDLDTLSMGVEYNKQYVLCKESANESLMDELLFSQEMNIDAKIRRQSQELTLASADGKQARLDWSACMEARGLVLDPIDGRPSAQYGQQGKEAEIQASVIEAECAASSGAVQKIFDIQARYEAAFMDTQAAQLKAFAGQRDKAIAVFEDAIAGR